MAIEERTQPTDDWPAFNGWLRTRGHRWAIVAQGETEREASDRLHGKVEEMGSGHYDLAVLPEGKRP